MSRTPERWRYSLLDMETLAMEVVDLLKLAIVRWEVVGSMRRRAPFVGDVELLLEPVVEPHQTDLFGNVITTRNLLDAVVDAYVEEETFSHRLSKDGARASGSRYKRLLYRRVPVDLFVCLPPAEWGVLEAIRTGPAAYAKWLVTPALSGGALPFGLRVQDGALYRGRTKLPTPDERSFFAAIGQAYVEAWERR